MAATANPEAIAWYLERSEGLLGQLRERVQALRARGAQLAAFSGAVLTLAGANVQSVLGSVDGIARDGVGIFLLAGVLASEEVSNYASERFTQEPDLWRIQIRTLRTVLAAIESTAIQGDKMAWTVRKAEYLFLAGLFSAAIALGTLIAVVAF